MPSSDGVIIHVTLWRAEENDVGIDPAANWAVSSSFSASVKMNFSGINFCSLHKEATHLILKYEGEDLPKLSNFKTTRGNNTHSGRFLWRKSPTETPENFAGEGWPEEFFSGINFCTRNKAAIHFILASNMNYTPKLPAVRRTKNFDR